MRILIVVALLLSLLVTVFAVQNNAATAVRFLFWSVEGSFALVLMITLVLGILIGVLLMLPGSLRQRLRAAGLERNLRELERRIQPPGPAADASGEDPPAERPPQPSGSPADASSPGLAPEQRPEPPAQPADPPSHDPASEQHDG